MLQKVTEQFSGIRSLLRQGPPLRGTVLLAAFISCYASFINGYPLVHQDTGTYIHSGFESIIPFDRPVFYGFFVYFFSTSYTLFPVIFVQALLVCFVLELTLRLFLEGTLRSVVLLLLVVFLTLFTSFSYIVCTLVPDVFTPIVFLCLLNILLNNRVGLWQLLLLGLLLVFGLCTQFSSLYVAVICMSLLLGTVAVQKFRRRVFTVKGSRLMLAASLIVAPFLILPLTNYMYNGEFKVQSAGPVFFVNHANETGILKVFLDEDCPRGTPYKLCAYRDSLVWDFIWQAHSPFHKLGGWTGNQEEYRHIMWQMLTRKKFLFPLLQKGMEGTVRQLFFFDVPLVEPQREGSAPFEQVRWRYRPTLRDYQNSAHYNARLDVSGVNRNQRVVFLFSLVLLFVAMVFRPWRELLSPNLKIALIFFFIYMLIQAGFSANLSTIDHRYQSRVTWLLPVFTLLCFFVTQKKENGGEAR